MTEGEPRPQTTVDDLNPWILAYERANGEVVKWKQAADRARGKIVAALEKANAEIGTVAGRPRVRYVTVTQRRIDTARFRDQHPELARVYERPVISHRFTVVDQAAELSAVDTDREAGAA